MSKMVKLVEIVRFQNTSPLSPKNVQVWQWRTLKKGILNNGARHSCLNYNLTIITQASNMNVINCNYATFYKQKMTSTLRIIE